MENGRFPQRDDAQPGALTVGVETTGLQRSLEAGLWEAVVFYSARLLERLALAAHAQIFPRCRSGGENPLRDGSLDQYLQDLEGVHVMTRSVATWARMLRLAGNDARHGSEATTRDEAVLCAAVALRLIAWFRREVPWVLVQGQEEVLSPVADVRELEGLMKSFEECEISGDGSAHQELFRDLCERSDGMQVPWVTNHLKTLIAERLLFEGNGDAARSLLEGIEKHPDRRRQKAWVRARQLLGLYFSRTNDFDRALEYLAFTRSPDRSYDAVAAESVGIRAGVRKRQWRKTGEIDSLRESYRLYREEWDRSKPRGRNEGTDTYNGINAATLGFILASMDPAAAHQVEESRHIARQVVSLLEDKQACLQEARGKAARRRGADESVVPPSISLGYWYRVTLAEGMVLLGRNREAREAYRSAFRDHQSEPECLRSTLDQLTLLLDKATTLNMNPEERSHWLQFLDEAVRNVGQGRTRGGGVTSGG